MQPLVCRVPSALKKNGKCLAFSCPDQLNRTSRNSLAVCVRKAKHCAARCMKSSTRGGGWGRMKAESRSPQLLLLPLSFFARQEHSVLTCTAVFFQVSLTRSSSTEEGGKKVEVVAVTRQLLVDLQPRRIGVAVSSVFHRLSTVLEKRKTEWRLRFTNEWKCTTT